MKRLGFWIGGVFLFGLLWRAVRFAADFPMWGDEAFVAVNFFTRGFKGMLDTLDHDMVVPLGFLWTNLACTELLGRAEWGLRFLPWLAGIVSLILFRPLARNLLGRHAGLLALAVFAASYYPVRHAAEVKHYSFDLLFALLILGAAWRLLRDMKRPASWAGYILLTGSAVWFSYTSVFVSGGAALVLGWATLKEKKNTPRVAWLASGIVLLASFIAMYLLVGSKQQWDVEVLREGQWAAHFPPLAEPWKLPLWLVKQHTGNMFAYPNGGRTFGSAATTLLVVLGCVALWRKGARALVLLLLSSLPLMFVAAAFDKYPYGGTARTNLHLAPVICLLAGAGATACLGRWLSPRRAVMGVRVAAALMTVVMAAGIVMDVVKPYKKLSDAKNRDMVLWLSEETAPDDRWILFGRFGECAHAPDLYPWGGSAARMRYYLMLYGEVPVLWAPDPAEIRSLEKGRTWLIVYHDNHAPFPGAQWAAYLQAVESRLGAFRVHAFPFNEKKEKAEVLEFPGP